MCVTLCAICFCTSLLFKKSGRSQSLSMSGGANQSKSRTQHVESLTSSLHNNSYTFCDGSANITHSDSNNTGGWSRRKFPLCEQEVLKLTLERPPRDLGLDACDSYGLRHNNNTTTGRAAVHVPRTSTSRDVIDYEDCLLDSPPQSPSSASTLAADDKEWTVKEVRTQSSSLIMKIAKR